MTDDRAVDHRIRSPKTANEGVLLARASEETLHQTLIDQAQQVVEAGDGAALVAVGAVNGLVRPLVNGGIPHRAVVVAFFNVVGWVEGEDIYGVKVVV